MDGNIGIRCCKRNIKFVRGRKVMFNKFRSSVLKRMFWDQDVENCFRRFQRENPDFLAHNHLKAIHYIFKLNSAQYHRIPLSTIPVPKYKDNNINDISEKKDLVKYYLNLNQRKSVNELVDELKDYDVISFDIFDTAIFRKVEKPSDIFTIMAYDMGHNDFTSIREKADRKAREFKNIEEGNREVTLFDIYDILDKHYNIDLKWMEREIELEIERSVVNPYIYEVYQKLLDMGKTIIFMTDMYLPYEVITQMLQKNGYAVYEKLYLSNVYKINKGNGELQLKVMEDYEGKRLVHVGDNYASDIVKSQAVGLDAVYNPTQVLSFREANMDNMSGSIYRAIINNELNNGLWNENIYFEHGFRVGGILTVGFCQYINRIASEKGIDKILFCARDCEVIWKTYNQYFKEHENEYIEISRYAIFNITPERYLYDWLERSIIRYKEQAKKKTIEEVLIETGFGYLVDYLEDDDIERYLYTSAIKTERIRDFIFNHKEIIYNNCLPNIEAAKKYFSGLIGIKQNILIVDIGWSGTCITALKYFLEKNLPDCINNVFGALMCTNRTKTVMQNMDEGVVFTYLYSPYDNLDLARFMFPAKVSAKRLDTLHMPLEFIFTSKQRSLIKYVINEKGMIDFIRTDYEFDNKMEIDEIHRGILKFTSIYKQYESGLEGRYDILPYVAMEPLRDTIRHIECTYEIYKNFSYDTNVAPFVSYDSVRKFGELIDHKWAKNKEEINGLNHSVKRILFITPELTYTGTPRSLLRMAKVAVTLGYDVTVWSALAGPFEAEYKLNNILVEIVGEKELDKRTVKKRLNNFDLAVCNTIMTDKYVRICGRVMPVVWYIREATNILDFCRTSPDRLYTLRHSKNVYCVSDYAAEALRKYVKHKIRVVHNCVEDETEMAVSYEPPKGRKIRFVQFGTMEYRKGYDVLIAAYELMPKGYQDKTELFFAGGFINSGTSYCAYLFEKIRKYNNIHYLGIVKGEKNKIEILSQMDVVVVASRDESCSLVALEGAMLSKPLIVTENVGAKYIVNDKNGIIVKTGNVKSLSDALMEMIDRQSDFENMGRESRSNYLKYASMDSYTNDMKTLYNRVDEKKMRSSLVKSLPYAIRFNTKRILFNQNIIENTKKYLPKKHENVIVSLTSFPDRISTIDECIQSLLHQTCIPKKVILWLSEEQFPNREEDLPYELLKLAHSRRFEISWTKDDLKPHKKYFYVMQQYPDLPIIIVDDDVIYDKTLIEKLMRSYRKFPDCISAMRANLIMFKDTGELRQYDHWIYEYRALTDTPSFQLLPTGVGGVLYPPNSIRSEAFNKEAIFATSLYCDDLWLKINAVMNNVKTVVPNENCRIIFLEGTQDVALAKMNALSGNNDLALKKILDYLDTDNKESKLILEKMRKDRFA